MTARILPFDEWPKLEHTTAQSVWRNLDPLHVDVIVVEEYGRIIGQTVMMDMIHAECFEIAPDHQKRAAVARLLWEMASTRIEASGGKAMWASAIDDDMKALLRKHGAPVPESDHFILPILEGPCRPS